MKIVFYVGENIGLKSKVKQGILDINNKQVSIVSDNEIIELNDLTSIELHRLNGLGTMIKLKNAGETIYLSVYRLFFNVGTGFIIVDYFATKKIKSLIESIMKLQNVS